MKSHGAILGGLAAGLALGVAGWATGWPALSLAVRILEPVGEIFVNLLRMAVIPLVATALYAGVARLGNPRQLGRLTIKAFAFFWATTLVAIALGFVCARLILPLAPLEPERRAQLTTLPADEALTSRAAAAQRSGMDVIVEMVPRNPVAAAAAGDLLPVVVFSLISALATAALPEPKRRILVELADSATEALIRIVHWALWLAPIGVAGLIAPLGLRLGWAMLGTIGAFIAAVLTGLAILVTVIYFPALVVGGGMRPGRLVGASTAAFAMAFSSTSQVAALPLMLDAAEERLRLPRAVTGLVLPLGASLNRAGSALYQGVALLFLADLYGVALSPAGYVAAFTAVFFASLTVASVPAASVLSLAPALSATGVSLAGLGILLGVDRIPDMFRTVVNTAGTMVGTAFVARGEETPP